MNSEYQTPPPPIQTLIDVSVVCGYGISWSCVSGVEMISDQFKKIIKRYKRVGYSIDIIPQSARLVVNPITVDSYGFLFNCTTVGQASDLMTALT